MALKGIISLDLGSSALPVVSQKTQPTKLDQKKNQLMAVTSSCFPCSMLLVLLLSTSILMFSCPFCRIKDPLKILEN